MLGSELKASLMVHETNPDNGTEAFYFPPGVWCDVAEYSCFETENAEGEEVQLSVGLADINLHLREGKAFVF